MEDNPIIIFHRYKLKDTIYVSSFHKKFIHELNYNLELR